MNMDERLLHYIWKFQKFDASSLSTTTGEPVSIFHPGHHNHDSGPDFADARLKIDHVEWAGHVEIHTKASEWLHHGHDEDVAYDNVILHVVHEADREIQRTDGTQIPTVTLAGRISPTLTDRHRALTHTVASIPCETQIDTVDTMTVAAMIERAAMDRIEEKSSIVKELLDKTKGDWEQATYILLATSLGMKTNADSFRELALLLKSDVIRKHHGKPMQIEALVFGMAGFLDYSAEDDYHGSLQHEFQYLFKKYRLDSKLNKSRWKFAKLRPANFPTIRLSQLSAILGFQPSLFHRLIQATAFQEVTEMLTSPLSAYWQQHYDFGKPSKRPNGPPGKTAIASIIINAIVPLLVTYGKSIGDEGLVDKALDWLASVPPEDNKITRRWQALKISNASAMDSQGLLQLSKSYCDARRCLDCAIGNRILSS